MNGPKYPLEDVFKLIEQRAVDFSAPSRSLRAVQEFLEKNTPNGLSCREAESFIYEGIKQLTNSCFCRRIHQWGIVADEYGLFFMKINWYIKFAIEEDEDGKFLNEISFHPLEKNMKLANGKILDGVLK